MLKLRYVGHLFAPLPSSLTLQSPHPLFLPLQRQQENQFTVQDPAVGCDGRTSTERRQPSVAANALYLGTHLV